MSYGENVKFLLRLGSDFDVAFAPNTALTNDEWCGALSGISAIFSLK